MASLPRKLKKDPIAEAIFDIHFTCRDLPEVVVGLLASHWKGFTAQRLPVAEIPQAIRKVDPNFQYQPLMELRRSGHPRVVKIGEQVLSYHALAPYPGWSQWNPELIEVIDFVFSTFDGVVATRLGLRYVNALTQDHFISDISSLNFTVSVGGTALDVPLNLNYLTKDGEHREALIRVASRQFVTNPGSVDLLALIDVDVFTPKDFESSDPSKAKNWLVDAHEFEKREFFRLFDEKLIRKLREE
jgi:uncharacterized protein (TIGR04255 family)